jgi:hypothetical protein
VKREEKHFLSSQRERERDKVRKLRNFSPHHNLLYFSNALPIHTYIEYTMNKNKYAYPMK